MWVVVACCEVLMRLRRRRRVMARLSIVWGSATVFMFIMWLT